MVEERRAGDAAIGDANRAGPGLAGQFFGVGVPRRPGGRVLVEEHERVPGGDLAAVVADRDGVEAVGPDQAGVEAVLLELVDRDPANREVEAAVGDAGGLDVRGRDPGVDADGGDGGSPGTQVGRGSQLT
jgi:hypothetical protein